MCDCTHPKLVAFSLVLAYIGRSVYAGAKMKPISYHEQANEIGTRVQFSTPGSTVWIMIKHGRDNSTKAVATPYLGCIITGDKWDKRKAGHNA